MRCTSHTCVRELIASRHPVSALPRAPRERGGRAGYLKGLLTNLLNPKVAVFYLTFLPQFIPPGDPVLARSLVFALSHDVMALVWLTGYAYGVTRLARVVEGTRFHSWLDRITGLVLVSLGVRIAFERR